MVLWLEDESMSMPSVPRLLQNQLVRNREESVTTRAELEKLFTGIVVVIAAARDDELLALHPDPSVARVRALDVLDNVRAARRDADVAADVAFPLVADRGAVFAYAACSQVWETQRSENERSCSPPEYMPQAVILRLRMKEKLVSSK